MLCVIDSVGVIIAACINRGIANHVGHSDHDIGKWKVVELTKFSFLNTVSPRRFISVNFYMNMTNPLLDLSVYDRYGQNYGRIRLRLKAELIHAICVKA